ncbi:ATP-binding protein [Methylomagnum sp.]
MNDGASPLNHPEANGRVGTASGPRIRSLGWSATPLGPPADWSPALRAAVNLLLANRLPMVLWWGPRQVAIHNDAAQAELGAHTLWPLGEAASEAGGDLRPTFQPLIDATRQGESVWAEDVCLPCQRPGTLEPAHFAVGLSPVPDDTAPDGVGGVLATFHDITGKVLGERRRADALAELDRAKHTFLSNVSHEFRTPISLVLGPLEDLLAKPESHWPTEDRELLDMAHRNGQRLLRLVNSLLDFSRIEAGYVRATYEPTELAGYTAELAGAFRSTLEKAGLRLRVDCPPLAEPVYVDRDMWEKIVLNLVSNAFKHTLAGEIAVSLSAENGVAVLRVRDTGTGIPEAELPKLFERFHRVEDSRGRTQEGTGIGLALVRELSRLHRGTVDVASVLGRGSLFTVAVPLGKDHLPADHIADDTRRVRFKTFGAAPFVEEARRWLPGTRAEAAATPPGPAEYLRGAATPPVSHTGPLATILVADANADMRESLQRLLQAEYDVIAVADGHEAFKLASDFPPDLALVDAMLPNLNGMALLKALRADPSTAAIPVVIMSARAGEEGRAEMRRAGADDYLVKPFRAGELFARIGGALALARARREAEVTLRASEARWLESEEYLRRQLAELERLYHHAPVGLCVLDREFRFLRINERLAEIDGASVAAHLGRTVREMLPSLADSLEPVYRRVIGMGESVQEMDLRGETPGQPGVSRDWVASYVPVLGADGAILGVGCVVTEVTARRRAEAALRESETHLAITLESADLGSWHWSIHNGVMRFNRRWAEMLGYQPEDIAPCVSSWKKLIHPDDLPLVMDALGDHLAGRCAIYRSEHRLRTRHGDWLWVLDCGQVYERDGEGRPTRAAGVHIDINERKQAEAALHESEERLNLALIAAHMGVWEWNLLTGQLFWSPECYALFGVAEFDGWMANFSALIHPEDKPHVMGEVDRAIAERDTLAAEFRAIRPGGDTIWIASLARADYDDDDGRPVRMVGIFQDITERRAIEQALREADRRKDEFLAILAHELRNPLAPIRNGLQIMRRVGHDPDALQRARGMMERQVAHMVRLIDDLLDLSRISRGKIELHKERMELGTLARQAAETCQSLFVQCGHELCLDVPPEPIFVEADPTRLAQVLSNLLNNAAKYTEHGGFIELTVRRQDGEATVSVKDNGIGIPPHLLSKVFEMFTQVDQSLEKAQGGLGIGLSLAKQLMALHGGTIEARSEGKAKGSEFVVRLPVPEPSESSPSMPEAGGPTGATGCRRVLVVDDNLDGAASLAALIEILGHEVRAAHDGLEAIAVAEAFRPELILLDIGMPLLNGYDACRRMRREPWGQGIVIAALTGWGQDEDKRLSKEAGFDHHLVKPVDPLAVEELLAGLSKGATRAERPG